MVLAQTRFLEGLGRVKAPMSALGQKRTLKSSALTKEKPGTFVPGSFFTRLVLGPMSVGSVVIVTWTTVIVGTTTVIVWTATITVVVSTVIRSGSISVAVISRTIVVRP